jgi:hypothetical protein
VIGPFAHAGHWLASLAYLAPPLVLVGVIGRGKRKERRDEPDGSVT